ncbi:hypothetical protein A8990_15729 [Paenibacillus taihuensis]|uniref:DUF309 domain-containing protein n=1 Tax=Paenibacillus taihuensis TaxID=1156355 RepID=A0A3D9Q9J4_9BACL|nr:DUF309 domain-containing protein [Paenibacillus taihuensis]REE57383.1 hypothetical protein A8990_15729 [Paenibacillus taihuensis]
MEYKYPAAYEAYLYEFHATRDYFECHELLEEYWKEQSEDSRNDTWVGLIQLAVSSYHHRRSNFRGALLMMRQAENRLTAERLDDLGLDGEAVRELIVQRIAHLESRQPFTDLNFPIIDEALQARGMQRAEQEGHSWGEPSREADELIHRHTLRDRSEVIAARAEAAARRRAGQQPPSPSSAQ